MSSDLQNLESLLCDLRPAQLAPELLDRLESCATGTLAHSGPLDAAFENSLSPVRPAPLPPVLAARLLARLEAVPFPSAKENIVRFPAAAAGRAAKLRFRWSAVAAAAAVLGVLSALLIPVNERRPVTAGNHTRPSPPPAARPATAAIDLVPATFQRGLSEATDEGVVWQSPTSAHRVLRVVYNENITLRDSAGSVYQIEQPRVEYILVPAEID